MADNDPAAVVTVTDPEPKDQEPEPRQTEPKDSDDIAELKKTIESLKAAQSGSDKKVRELLETLEKEKKAAKEGKAEKLTLEQRLEKIEQEAQSAKASALRQEQITLAVKELTAKGLPTTRAEKLAGANAAETMANIEAEVKDLAEYRQKILEEALGKEGREVGSGSKKRGDTTLYTKEQLDSMTAEEINTNWEKVQESLTHIGK
jgi:predicted amidohydrolase YtcJ